MINITGNFIHHNYGFFFAEESPRNAYPKLKSKDLSQLDDWFNLTATLNFQSDFPIQYRSYRIKPNIGKLIENKFRVTLNQSSIPLVRLDSIGNENSTYLKHVSNVIRDEYFARRQYLIDECPYSCNQPLPVKFIEMIHSDLPKLEIRSFDRQKVHIAWFVSNCNTHSRRENFVRQLRAQPGINIDIYGNCQSIFHSRIVPETCRKGTPQCVEKLLSHYRFYLSFENSKCDGYITEKYWIQGLDGHAVPIVLGTKKTQYEQIAVPNSFLHVDDFDTVEHLAEELHRLNKNDDEYSKYLRWTQIYDVSENYTFRTTNQVVNSLCLLGHYQRLQTLKQNSTRVTIDLIQQTIKDIFDISRIPLINMIWSEAQTKPIEISKFHDALSHCWDESYPSFFERIYNYLFSWL